MNKLAIVGLIVLATIFPTMASGCGEAIFEVSNLTVSPQKVESGQTARISVDITNTGGAEGNYTVILKIDGFKRTTQKIKLYYRHPTRRYLVSYRYNITKFYGVIHSGWCYSYYFINHDVDSEPSPRCS